MKKYIFLFLCATFLTSFTSISFSDFNIVGKWTGTKDGDTGSFIFKENGYLYFSENGTTYGGKGFVDGDETFDMTYKIDYSKNPIEFDLIKTRIIPSKDVKISYAIIEIIDENKIRICFDIEESSKRPTEFIEESSIYLSREK